MEIIQYFGHKAQILDTLYLSTDRKMPEALLKIMNLAKKYS